ncbi:hypothetical protein [Streptomyces apocyni]|uniref:hypothetical protein n=1 Tax=Streptomyces apocyni TaxID=2654677 RepID=UPI0012E99857|nr:hypothetical protein [Streptomyces apocyni]
MPLQTTPEQVTLTSREEKDRTLRVTPKSLTLGSESDLSHLGLDVNFQHDRPYYLAVAFTNTGPDTLDRPDLGGYLYLAGPTSSRSKAVLLADATPASASDLPKQCRKGNPAELAAGKPRKSALSSC